MPTITNQNENIKLPIQQDITALTLKSNITRTKRSVFLLYFQLNFYNLFLISSAINIKLYQILFSLISSVCMLLVILALGRISLYALYTTFFFMSIMFPTIFALGLSNMGTLTKKASSYIVMGVAGGAFSPMLMGLIGENNMAVGFIVPFVAFIYILFFAAKGYRS